MRAKGLIAWIGLQTFCRIAEGNVLAGKRLEDQSWRWSLLTRTANDTYSLAGLAGRQPPSSPMFYCSRTQTPVD